MQRFLLALALLTQGATGAQLRQQQTAASHGLLARRSASALVEQDAAEPKLVSAADVSGLAGKPKLMGAINKFRAEKCAHLYDKHSKDFGSYRACLKFMMKVCAPGSDLLMDGDKGEITSGEGFCSAFFPEKITKKVVEDAGKELGEDLEKSLKKVGKDGEGGETLDDVARQVGGEIDADRTDEEEEEGKARGLDTDGDGIPDITDLDDDNDGTPDEDDAFPLDSTETVDTDGDGIGNNKDKDDDGDGFKDEEDLFPLDATEHRDNDNDGIPDNVDDDDDNDGALDAEDDFPLDASKFQMKYSGTRFHMSEKVGLPEQGYLGEPVEHNDMETSVDDWQREYGPKMRQ